MIDIGRVRRDTPGVERVIHFNNAGSSLSPDPVVRSVIDYIRLEALTGGYEIAAQYRGQIDEVYELAAQLIGADKASEIAITENATRGWDMVFYGLKFRPGDRIIVSAADYGSNAIAYLHHAVPQGAVVRVVRSDRRGQLDLVQLEQELKHPRARMVSLVHIPTQSGLVNPARDVGLLAKKYGVLYLLDACQSVGQVSIDVRDIGCDVLSATGRKYLRGPRGTGFLYVADAAQDQLKPAFLENGSAVWDDPWSFSLKSGATRYESWERSYALTLGLGSAIRYALDIGVDNIQERNGLLAEELRTGLRSIPQVAVADPEGPRSAIVSFAVDHEIGSERLKAALYELGVNVSVSRCTSSQWDLTSRGLSSVVRASVHYYNTSGEVHSVLDAIKSIVAGNVGSASTVGSVKGAK